jgi:hypothetical protein
MSATAYALSIAGAPLIESDICCRPGRFFFLRADILEQERVRFISGLRRYQIWTEYAANTFRKRIDEDEGRKAACLSVLSINLRPELTEPECEKNKQRLNLTLAT